jgi:hypothetical protein
MSAIVEKIKSIWAYKNAYVHRYLWPLPRFRREVVVMVDGKMTHGGLTDRLRNILSIYSYCKEEGIRFRVHYVYPCPLTCFLLPNDYDWRIAPNELSYHILDSREIGLYVKELPGTGEKKSSSAIDYNNHNHITILDKEISKRKRTQFHIYGNAYFAQGHYRPLFEDLFRPSPFLAKKVTEGLDSMPEPYEAVSLRFQMLLGDLFEGSYEVLEAKRREELIRICIEKIEELWQSHYFSTPKVLVTSDSALFLSRIKEKKYVYTIPGKMEHMDFTNNPDIEMNVKPFVDLFLLKEARRITSLRTGNMYKSGFPSFAAELGGKPFCEISF